MPEPSNPTPGQNENEDENEIDVFPAKYFFVDSLTRDIDLSDAILDLLDNCVDGVRRKGLLPGGKYDGYWAKITFNKSEFSIEDNCGGISLADAQQSAFRFGRPSDYVKKADGTIGVIGIGMKRAILKMGRRSTVHSHHQDDTFEVKITPEWLEDDDDWKLHFEKTAPSLKEHGTRIEVSDLNSSVQDEFGSARFKKSLHSKVKGAFSLLISRGFCVKINETTVEAKMPTLLWQEKVDPGAESIRPYVYRNIIDGVEVYLAVGFREEDKVPDEEDETRRYYTTEAAGWTVACNDRVVLYCDKSEQTGWGSGGVPEYHTQFINISGFAEFISTDTEKLPFTTTKHGVNQQASVYLKVIDLMREGTKLFTDWTNRIKPYATQKPEIFAAANAKAVTVEEIKSYIQAPTTESAETKTAAVIAQPDLPKPKGERRERRISFRRPEAEVRAVAEYLFGDDSEKPSKVGEACFDRVLNQADK